MINIPTEEIKQPSFHADELGFVFVWKGHLLRGIYPEAVSQAKGYFDSGFVDEVVHKGLFPKTWISEFQNEQFGLIIEHEKIEPVTYATEWNFQMLKDAALLVLEIAQIGWKFGYDMIDCHKLNVMFYHNHPIYVDLGSFVPAQKGTAGWKPFASFLRSYYYILDVWNSGASQVAKRMMSPHVEMADKDYWVYKSKLFRSFPSLLNFHIFVEKRLCELVNMSDEFTAQYVKKLHPFLGGAIKVARIIVSKCKLAPSQHFGYYTKRIQKFHLSDSSSNDFVLGDIEEYLIKALNEKLSDFTTMTVINNPAYHLDSVLLNQTKISKIYSIQENESLSRAEYCYYQERKDNVTCLQFPLSGGEILIRGKFPEERLSSEIVLMHRVEITEGKFGIHNMIMKIKILMKYTTVKTIVMTTLIKNREFIEKLKEIYNVTVYNGNFAIAGGGRLPEVQWVTIIISTK